MSATVQISSLMKVSEVFDTILNMLRKLPGELVCLKSFLPYTFNLDCLNIIYMHNGENAITEFIAAIRKDNAKKFEVAGTKFSKSKATINTTLRQSGMHLDSFAYFLVEFKRYSDFIIDTEEKEASANSDSSDDDKKGYRKTVTRNDGGRGYMVEDSQKKRWGYSSMGKEETQKPTSKMGVCGLKNLGNTCYMNSALQCLSNCKDLTEYFLKKHYADDKNLDNPLGSKCKLLEAYYNLINHMWYGEDDAVSPSDFKYEMGSFQSAVGFVSYLVRRHEPARLSGAIESAVRRTA